MANANQVDQAMTATNTNIASSTYDHEMMTDQEGKPFEQKGASSGKAYIPLDVNQRFNIAVLH